MNVSPDQVRAATRSAAAVITPDKVPPLRLREAPADHGRARWPWMAWTAPLAAAAAVAIVVAGTVAAGSWFARSGHGPPGVLTHGAGAYTSAGTVPAYYVAIGNRSYAAVKATATGATLAKVRAHAPFVGVTGAADDQTFVLDAQRQVMGPTVLWPGQPAFYLLRLNGSGAEQSLTRLAVPALPKGTWVTGLALSPDGSKLAVYVGSGRVDQRARQEIMIDTLATGTTRTWSADGPPYLEDPDGFTGSGVDGSQSISWTSDSATLAFEWGSQSDVGVRLLDTTASGDSLLADSRAAVTLTRPGPAPGSAAKRNDHLSQCVTDAILTPDGSAIICGYTTTTAHSTGRFDTTTGFIRYSARTGKPARVFGVFQFQGQAGGDISLYWTSPPGNILIGAILTPRGIHVGVINGQTFTPLPSTAGIADAAW